MRYTKHKLILCLAAVLCLAAPYGMQGQVLYGSLVGTVEDPSGALVPNATVTISSGQTGLTRDATTDASGRYSFSNVLPGVYDVKVVASGFRTTTQSNVQVNANESARVDMKLQVGQATETVTIQADAQLLQTERADTQTEISTKPVETLPLNLYRNYQALVNLVPGATPAQFQNSSTDTPGRSLRTWVNGTAPNMNTTRLDGAVNVNIWLPHHAMYVAPAETIQTVNVTTSSRDAEIGMAGGAAITVVTKSGTNELHGSLFEYHYNQRLKSRPYFMPSTQQKPRDTNNNFGGTLGGPIIKNRLFYFGSYDGTRQRIGGSGIYDVPTAALRSGNFSQAFFPVGSNTQTVIYDPATGDAQGRGRTAFPNNVIPQNRISPIAQRVLGLLPGPNLAGERQNLALGGTGRFDRDLYDYKFNLNPNDRYQVWYKGSFMNANVGGVAGFGELVGPGLGGDPALGHTFTQVHTVGHTFTLRPTVLLDQNFGFTRQSQNVLGNDYGRNYGLEVFGIPGTNGPDIRQSGLPNFSFGYTDAGLGQTWLPLFRVEQSFTHNTNLSWLRGGHEFRFGADIIRHHLNHWQPEVANPRGAFSFGGGITALNGGAAPNFYNQFAAFLLGLPSNVSKSLQYIEMTGREWQTGFYARDRWQATRRLTLNLGVRFEYYPLMTRRDSGIERLDLDTMTVLLGGRGNVPKDAGINTNSFFIAPSLGLAFRTTDSTVLRAGYSLAPDPLPFSRPLRGWYPLTVAGNFAQPNDFVPAVGPNGQSLSLATGVPPVVGPDLSTGRVPLPPTVDMRSPWTELNRGYIQSWNFTVEQRLPSAMVGTVAYVGTKTTHWLADRDINAAMPGLGNAGRPFARQPYNRLIAINMWDGWLDANYHSLQSTLNRRFDGGLFLQGAYTWSKAINMTDESGWASVSWNSPEVASRNRALAGFDRTHIFQMAFIYEPPVGRGKRFVNSGPLSWILGNWSLNGVAYAMSGTPFTVGGGAACNCPGNTQTATQIAPLRIIDEKGPGAKYFDPASFTAGVQNQFGSVGRNSVRGPGYKGIDGSIFRIFRLTERLNAEFRAEAFNVTNSPRFSNPAASVTGANFGEIRAASGERQVRFGARLSF